MKTSILFPAGAILAPVFLTLLESHSLAQARARESAATSASVATPPSLSPDPAAIPTPPVFTFADPSTSVLYDEPGDGRLWALGASWKASFGADGALYFPRVGPRERSFAHALSPDAVTIGGTPLSFAHTTEPVRTGDRVELDRGSFIEAYDLAPESVEQSFVFASSPGAGDLVLHIPIASELQALETEEGLEFRSERGRVTYSRAIAVDALGRRTSAATRLEDGSITIRVGADFLANTQFPLVVDPVVGAIFPEITQEDTFSPDAAYDVFNGVWVVTYEQVFSATDHDVYAKEYNNAGVLLATATVDFTGDLWAAPRIADLAFPHKFLVVAGVTAVPSGAKTVRGRVVQPNGTLLTMDAQFSISGSLTGNCIRPDVGGDPFPSVQAFWCVAFEHDISSTDQEIAYCIVTSSSLVITGPIHLTHFAGSPDTSPSISKSDDTSAWLIAWQRDDAISFLDIAGAQVDWAGSVISGPFTIAGGFSFDSAPAASSPISGTQINAVAFTRGLGGFGGGRDIMVALLDGSTVLQTVDLMTLEHSSTAGQDQVEPSVDSDGTHFLVAYSEPIPAFAHDEVFATDLAVSGNTLQVVQNHLHLGPGFGQDQRTSNVAAARAPGTLAHRYLTMYAVRENDQDHDIFGNFVDGIAGGDSSPFCFGDGTGTACPCGNSGASGHGCANSVDPGGALLTVTGTPSTVEDSLVLHVSGLPATSNCTFFQGTAANAATVFGDGLRCAGGSVVRLRSTTASAGAADFPSGGDPHVSVQGLVPANGGLRTYQVSYRNAAPTFCTSATFNISSGVIIDWAR